MQASGSPATPGMNVQSRPLGLAVAVALLALIGVAGLMVGPYLVILGLWLATERVGDAAPLVLATETIIGVGAVVTGIAALYAARGLWRGRPWAWPVALLIALVLLAGMCLVVLLERWLAAYALVVVVAAGLLASLLPGSVRRQFGL